MPHWLVATLGAAALATVVAHLAIRPAHAQSDDTIGEWRRPDGTRIQLHRCKELLCGRIVMVPDHTRMDLANPNPRLRVRPVTGAPVLTDGRRTDVGWKGKLYEPDSGRTYSARFTPEGRVRLNVSLCPFLKIFCSAESWERVR